MCAKYNTKIYTCNVREGVPPAPLPPPKRVFAPTPPPSSKFETRFHRFQIITA